MPSHRRNTDVLGNRDRLKQVVFNLVENASRFIEPGGHITVELMGARGNSVLSVRDDGCGLGDADPKLLFDRFYRGDPSRNRGTGGTGLGLAIVKSVVDAHDGTVEAFNLPDGGACFLVGHPLDCVRAQRKLTTLRATPSNLARKTAEPRLAYTS